jgi:hypothetical protein
MNKQLSTLASRAKRAYEHTKQGRTAWLTGTFELAGALSKARNELPADQEFSSWLAKAGLTKLSKDDRAALITIGSNAKAARAYFRANDSWSWRLCAAEVRSVSQAAKPAAYTLRVQVERSTKKFVTPYYINKVEPNEVVRDSKEVSDDETPEDEDKQATTDVTETTVDPEYPEWLATVDEAHKASARALSEFTVACKTWLPKMTAVDQAKASQLVTKMTWKPPKAGAADVTTNPNLKLH